MNDFYCQFQKPDYNYNQVLKIVNTHFQMSRSRIRPLCKSNEHKNRRC
ncbi:MULTISPECIES: hypothetical protein [Alistipes]|nr:MULTISPECIES: hypothetical protein [Alistipes]